MDRMASHSKQPEVRRELYAALGNDPYVIAETLARQELADGLIRSAYGHDERFHGERKQRAEVELSTRGSVARMRKLSGEYNVAEFVKENPTNLSLSNSLSNKRHKQVIDLTEDEWQQQTEKLAELFSGKNQDKHHEARLFLSDDFLNDHLIRPLPHLHHTSTQLS